MSSFFSGFTAATQYQGSGSTLPSQFFSSFPPEAGCIGMQTDEALAVQGKVTDFARQMLARSTTDGTAFKISKFAVGISGYNIAFPLYSIPVDPTLNTLGAEVYRDTIDLVESPLTSGNAAAFVCRLSKDDIRAGIGEIGLIAEIISSPYPSEVGTTFLFCAVHQPLNAKTYYHVQTYRIVIVF